MSTELKNLEIEEIAFVDKGAGKGVKVALFKRNDEQSEMSEETRKMNTLEEILGAMSEDDAAVVLQALEEAKAAEAKEAAEEEEDEKAEKQEEEEEDETLQKRFRVMKSENEQLQQRIQKMEIAQEREAFAKRAECFPNIPTFSTEELGDFLMQINKNLAPELAEKTEQMIKSVNELCGDSAILREFGKSGTGARSSGSAMATAEAMAAELIAKDPSITKAIALNKVWDSNTDLRNQYREERRGNK